MGEIPDEEFNELDDANEAMMGEQRKMESLEDDLTSVVKELVLKHYPEIFHLESNGYKALDRVIRRSIDRLVRDVNDITCTMGEE